MVRARRFGAHLAAALASRSGLTTGLRRRRRRTGPVVSILEYHDVIADRPEPEGAISVARFRRHVAFLKTHYRLVTVSEAVRQLADPTDLTEELVALTFDDGYVGNHRYAWTVLAELGVPASVYLTTGFLDRGEIWFDVAIGGLEGLLASGGELPAAVARICGETPLDTRADIDRLVERLKYATPAERRPALEALRTAYPAGRKPATPLSWHQVREMQSAGCEIGAHTVSHPILATLSPTEQEEEIRTSQRRIADETGVVPTSFAFPNGDRGDFDADTLAILRAAGFRNACTTLRGVNRPGDDPMTLRRIGIGPDSTALLAARLAGLFESPARRLAARS